MGFSSSPSSPIPFELPLPLDNKELSNEDETSDLPDVGKGLLPNPPNMPSKNEFCASALPNGDPVPIMFVTGSLAAVPSLNKRP